MPFKVIHLATEVTTDTLKEDAAALRAMIDGLKIMKVSLEGSIEVKTRLDALVPAIVNLITHQEVRNKLTIGIIIVHFHKVHKELITTMEQEAIVAPHEASDPSATETTLKMEF
jgi:hypothetical protein